VSGLPGILKDVEEVAGTAAALKLAERHGGTMISLSAVEGSAFASIVGRAAAMELVLRLGRGKVMVPMANVRGQKGRRAKAAELIAKGASVRDVALACDIHERTGWRVKAPPKSRPADLFDRED